MASEKVVVTGKPTEYGTHAVEDMILTVRGQKVILDKDLAALYGVETKMLNRALKRNINRFPADFVFRLTAEEDKALRCQIGTSKGRGGRRNLPIAFTDLIDPPATPKSQLRPTKKIGFEVKEPAVRYGRGGKRNLAS